MPNQTILSKTTNRNLLAGQVPGQPVTLQFENNKTAILPNDHPMSELWVKRIDFLYQSKRPVYVTTDNNEVITEVLMPVSDKVTFIDESGATAVAVALFVDSAVYFLERDNADFELLLSVLRDAHSQGAGVLVTASEPGYKIVDVRPLAGNFVKGVAGIVPEEDITADSFARLTPISDEKAKALFEMARQRNCSPCEQTKTCIPFMYPSSGCWIRAHLMCFDFTGQKIIPGKAWCTGSNPMLKTWTANNVNCDVSWAYHVAPIVLVAHADGTQEPMVIDPSMCTEPVTAQAWKGMMDRGSAKLHFSDWEQYDRGVKSEATPAKAQHDMNEFRLLLEATCKSTDGPPPYENCKR